MYYLTRTIIKKLPERDRYYIRCGAATTAMITWWIAYRNYRVKLRKMYSRSFCHYRMSDSVENVTPYKSLYWTWWRMPAEEYEAYHLFKPYYIIGQIDYSKEILIPRKRLG